MADIKPMRRVSAYRTSDDRLHNTRPAAIRHQAELDLTAWLSTRIPGGDEQDAKELAILLIDNGPGEDGIIAMIRQGLTPDSKKAR